MQTPKPIILTQSQIECKDNPTPPSEEYMPRNEEGLLTKDAERVVALYMTRQKFVIDDCKSQLSELGTVLKVQGATITNVPPKIEENKPSLIDRIF